MSESKKYIPSEIEKKWQDYWRLHKTYQTKDTSSEKFYILDMFPYPSGEGLHVGHPKGYIATDVYARMKRMQGFDVLHPMGFDAFGLPAEQYAIKNKTNPKIATEKNVARYKEQLEMLGLDYDWSREVNTTDPNFYKWTQWMWKQMYKQGLAYESYDPINWCPSCKTGLSNEDLDGNQCERCGTVVEKKPLRQWTIRITDYADRLLEDVDALDWEPHIKELQKNWIGKSEGAEINFELFFTKNKSDNDNRGPNGERAALPVFTTRPDTLFGVSYLVIAPEHPWLTLALDERHDVLHNKDAVIEYVKSVKTKTDIERTDHTKDKTGVLLEGVFAVHPLTREHLPIYVADYVLANYGTGVVMAVPAHDKRDFEFATKYSLPVKEVIRPYVIDHINTPRVDKETVVRANVHAIVRDPKTDTYLILRNAEHGWDTVVIGGIENNEDAIEAARREIAEETGYTDLKYIRTLGSPVQAGYFAKHKDQNRVAVSTCVYFELASDERNSEYEDEGNEILWIDKKNFVPGKMINSELSIWLERLGTEQYVPYFGKGILVNSGEFDSLSFDESKKLITEKAGGKLKNQYKLRDWVFARQRYWGEPFPIVFDENHTPYVVADSELPVVLPDVENYEPTGTGESPLAAIESWVNVYGYINDDNEFVSCDETDSRAKLFKRETNTMPQWAGSSWYYLRYIDTQNTNAFAEAGKEKKWAPVDFYVGGAEHATRHLIYARFWHKFLYDQGLVSQSEPFKKLQTVGLIMAEDGRKMSKRWGNVVNPDDVVREHGADTLRLYEMFMGPFDQSVAWSTKSLAGQKRFLNKVWNYFENDWIKNHEQDIKNSDDFYRSKFSGEKSETIFNKTIKKVTEDISNFKFNTAISTLMVLVNSFYEVEQKTYSGGLTGEDSISRQLTYNEVSVLLKLLAPFAPHMAEELWVRLGNKESIHVSEWPTFDLEKTLDDEVTYSVSINGKLRATLESERGIDENVIVEKAKALSELKKWLEGKEIKKVVFVQDKMVNIVAV